MEFISAKAYARKYKMSIFQVVKMARSGKIPSETKIVDGLEQLFVADISEQLRDTGVKNEKLTLESLQKEIDYLKREIKKLESHLDKCCPQHKSSNIY